MNKAPGKSQEKIERRQRTTCNDPKTVRELLGELYTDKEYLEKLLQETGLCHANDYFSSATCWVRVTKRNDTYENALIITKMYSNITFV